MNKYTQWIISAGLFVPSLALAQVTDVTTQPNQPTVEKKVVQLHSSKKATKKSAHRHKHKHHHPVVQKEYAAAPVYKDVYAPPPPVQTSSFPCIQNSCTGTPGMCGGFRFNGYVDVSYNHLSRSNLFTSGVNNRVFDLAENGFTLQQIGLTLAKQPEQGFGGLVNVLIGRDAIGTAAYGWNPGSSRVTAVDPLQVFLQYATGKFTIIGGKFLSLPDNENIDPTVNFNYSHSYLFGYGEPGTLLGLRGVYDATNNLSLIVGVNNGWDSIRDFRKGPTLELGVNYDINSQWSVTASDYLGRERLDDFISTGDKSTRNLFNIFTTFKATDKLTLVANAIYGHQSNAVIFDFDEDGDLVAGEGRATWKGIAGYANYAFNDNWRIALRGEIFDDGDSFRTGVPQTLKELTLTLGYAPVKCMEFRLETRRDWSNRDAFVNKDGIGTSRNQQSYSLEAYYKF